MESKAKIEYSTDDSQHEISELLREKDFDSSITTLLTDYYIKGIGMMDLKGGKAGVIFYLGTYPGKIVSATGREYVSVGIAASAAIDVGPGRLGRFYGPTKFNGERKHFTSDKFLFPSEIFIAGVSESTEVAGVDGSNVKLVEYAVTPLSLGSMTVMKPFKLAPNLLWRDFKYLRNKLNLIPSKGKDPEKTFRYLFF